MILELLTPDPNKACNNMVQMTKNKRCLLEKRNQELQQERELIQGTKQRIEKSIFDIYGKLLLEQSKNEIKHTHIHTQIHTRKTHTHART